MVNVRLFIGFYTSQVVQDFVHQQYHQVVDAWIFCFRKSCHVPLVFHIPTQVWSFLGRFLEVQKIAPRKVFGSLGFEASIDIKTTKHHSFFIGWEFPRGWISFTPNMGSYELWAQSLATDILKVHHRLGVPTRLDACQKSSKHNLHPKKWW